MMKGSIKAKGLIKKAIAVTLGITMAFGALMLPNDRIVEQLPAASALTTEINGNVFEYYIEPTDGITVAVISGAEGHGETVELPSVINHDGVDYPVYSIGNYFLSGDKTIKTLIVPDSVRNIYKGTLSDSSVEKVILPDTIKKIDKGFCNNCPNLSSVECSHISYRR